MRIKSRWHNKGKEHTVEDTASALAFISWRIAQDTVLHMENEDYQTDTLKQRLDVIFEMVAFLIHVSDRLTYESMDEEERTRFITSMGMNTLRQMRTNLNDHGMTGEQVDAEYLPLLNQRMADYSEFAFDEGQPSFNMRRYLGERITEKMGARDNKWVSQQVMDIEVPLAMENLHKGLENLLKQL